MADRIPERNSLATMLLIWPLRVLVPAVFLVLMVVFIRFPMGRVPDEGMLRLSWRTIGEPVRLCRKYTPEELEKLSEHMRSSMEWCETTLLPYRLGLWLDGRQVMTKVVRPAGLRGDRPLFVNEELLAAPGAHALRVTFHPLTEDEVMQGRDVDSAHAKALEQGVTRAPRYGIETTINVVRGRVVMVGLDEDTDTLILITRTPHSPR